MSSIKQTIEGIPPDVHEVLRTYVEEISKVFSRSLEGVILYGSAARGDYVPDRSNLNLLLLLSAHSLDTLKRYAKIHRRWTREQIVVPILLTEAELTASAASFPLEYLEMKDSHCLLAGRDPFVGLQVPLSRLAMEIEQQVRGNLLRIRQRYVEGGGSEEAMTILSALSVTSLLPCLRGLLRLLGHPSHANSGTLLKDVQSHLSLDVSAVIEAVNVKRGLISPGPLEVPRMFERYLVALDAFAQLIASLKQQGRI